MPMKYSTGVVPKKRKGKVVSYDGYLHYYDDQGERKTIHRERKKREDAREAIRLEVNKLNDRGPKALETPVTTFAQLADHCEEKVYIEAKYTDEGEKLFGVRSAATYKAHLKHTRAFFRDKKLEEITVDDLVDYRTHRLRSTRRGPNGTKVGIKAGTVARELNTLRAMLNRAKRKRWIQNSPFEYAHKNEVIKASDRKKRKLFLTFEQEIKLLKATETEDRRHLRALIIVAVDTGARFGELINLKKNQIDFRGPGTIIGLLNYKSTGGDKQFRNATMTTRVREVLLDIIQNPPKKAFKVQRGKQPCPDLVFGITSNVRSAWEGALKEAGLTHLGLHFHDLRHTPGTRVKQLIGLVDIANALGHKDPKTTAQVYINHDEQDLINFARAVEQAVETGYKQVMADEAKPDLASGLIS